MSELVTYSPRDGVTYTGHFVVSKGLVYVQAQGFEGKPSQVGDSPAAVVARFILMDMVREFRLTPDEEQ